MSGDSFKPGAVPLTAAAVAAVLVAAFALLTGGQKAASLGLTAHGQLVTAQDAGAADAVALTVVAPGTAGQVLTVGDAGIPVWRAAAGLPSDPLGIDHGGTGAATASAALAALRAETLSVSSTSAGNGSASGTATSITLGLPSGQSASARASEPATLLASTGVITGVEVIARVATLTSSSGPGLAVGIGDSGSGDAGAGCVLSVRIASDAAWDASVGASVVASNYASGGGGTFGGAGQDGNSWVRFVVSRDARYAIYAGRGASLAAAAWTRLASGDLTTALARNARANVRASLYSASSAGTTISAAVDSIAWTTL